MYAIRPVLIVGAGPTGLTAALELTRLGIPIRIVERLKRPSITSRALAVQSRTLELFEQRGLTEEMFRVGNIGIAATVYGDGKELGKVDLSKIKSRHNYILLLSQAETERILTEKLAHLGVFIERATEVISFSQRERVNVVLRKNESELEELEVDYLICAQGVHSNIRKNLGVEFVGKSIEQTYVLADLYLESIIPDNEITIFSTQHGFLAVFPMGSKRVRFIFTDPENHVMTDHAPSLEELQNIYKKICHIPGELRDIEWSSRFVINSRMVSSLRVGNVFLGGDSAHIHSPAGGQGMNTGIQDMINLCWKLAFVLKGKASPQLLNSYEEDRVPVISEVVKRTEVLTDVINSENFIIHQLITHAAPIALNLDVAKKFGTGFISELSSNYRRSSISTTHHHHGSLHAGDRLPDLDVVVFKNSLHESGIQDNRLYNILSPSALSLLIIEDEENNALFESARTQLALWKDILQIFVISSPVDHSEKEKNFSECFGKSSGLYIVRPDSYLGYVDGKCNWNDLLQWLEEWFSA